MVTMFCWYKTLQRLQVFQDPFSHPQGWYMLQVGNDICLPYLASYTPPAELP